MIIFKNQQYWIQRCAFKQVITGYDINPLPSKKSSQSDDLCCGKSVNVITTML